VESVGDADGVACAGAIRDVRWSVAQILRCVPSRKISARSAGCSSVLNFST
jgi:hypothetical protein